LRQLFQLGCSISTNVIILVILELIPYFFSDIAGRGPPQNCTDKNVAGGDQANITSYGNKIASLLWHRALLLISSQD
jgi:hypothetical protein